MGRYEVRTLTLTSQTNRSEFHPPPAINPSPLRSRGANASVPVPPARPSSTCRHSPDRASNSLIVVSRPPLRSVYVFRWNRSQSGKEGGARSRYFKGVKSRERMSYGEQSMTLTQQQSSFPYHSSSDSTPSCSSAYSPPHPQPPPKCAGNPPFLGYPHSNLRLLPFPYPSRYLAQNWPFPLCGPPDQATAIGSKSLVSPCSRGNKAIARS